MVDTSIKGWCPQLLRENLTHLREETPMFRQENSLGLSSMIEHRTLISVNTLIKA